MTSRIFSDEQLRKRDLETLKRYLRFQLGGYKVAIRDITTTNVLYRGVRWDQRPNKVDQLSYPPPDRVTKLGRVNRVGRSVFYASVSGPAVFYELKAKGGDLVALSEWQLVEPLWMHHLGYHQDALRKLRVSDRYPRRWLMTPIQDESKQNARLRSRLSLSFTEDVPEGQEYRYKRSIAINEILFDGASPLPPHPDSPNSTQAAGTVYPALRMRGAADNVAIWPQFVDRGLRLRTVRYVLVEAADEAKSSYTFLTLAMSGAISGRDIFWQENVPPEIERRSHIALEDGAWVFRDGFGRIRNWHSVLRDREPTAPALWSRA